MNDILDNMHVFIIGFILFLAIGFTYMGRRMFSWLRMMFPRMKRGVYTVVYVFIIFLPTISYFLPAGMRFVLWVGMTLLAFFLYLFIFQIICDVITWVGRFNRLYFNGVAVLLALAVTVGGIFHARNIVYVEYEIHIDGVSLPSPITIVLISDLHLGGFNGESRLEYMVARINALNPDMVCIPGDIFDGGFKHIKNPDWIAEQLRSIHATYGVFASLGNHDAGVDFYRKMDLLERGGIQVLREEHVLIGEHIALVGRNDAAFMGYAGDSERFSIDDILSNICDSKVIVVMDHNPAGMAEHDGLVDLLMSGHTHRGQLFPINFITRVMFKQDYGYYRTPGSRTHVIVTSGINGWGPPVRIGTNNEIVKITLR